MELSAATGSPSLMSPLPLRAKNYLSLKPTNNMKRRRLEEEMDNEEIRLSPCDVNNEEEEDPLLEGLPKVMNNVHDVVEVTAAEIDIPDCEVGTNEIENEKESNNNGSCSISHSNSLSKKQPLTVDCFQWNTQAEDFSASTAKKIRLHGFVS